MVKEIQTLSFVALWANAQGKKSIGLASYAYVYFCRISTGKLIIEL